MTDESVKSDILILGAGMAGLTAARALLQRGLRVTLLEARDRTGGRILTHHVEGASVELGAEFVHGRAPELWALIDEAGLATTERSGTMLRADYETNTLETDDPQAHGMFAPLEAFEDTTEPDQPFAQWLAASDLPEDDRQALTAYVEGFNAADANIIGTHSLGAQQKAEDSTEGGSSWHIHGGYAQLTDYLTAEVTRLGGRILLNTEADEITWQPGHVEVVTATGAMLEAPRCLVTLPLGVLQRVNHGGVILQPEPEPIEYARRLAMGHVVRFTLVFRTCWWATAPVDLNRDALAGMSFLFTPASMPPVWWTGHPEPEPAAHTLTGWVGGPRSAALASFTETQLAEEACATLAAIFRLTADQLRDDLLSTHTHNWSADPYALGAYSYVPAGALDAPRAMTVPVAGTLFFAGEHTDTTGHWGTVHAAMRSGLRAAQQILDATGNAGA